MSQAAPNSVAASRRLWEVDLARGITVILMIYFHLMWDLSFLGLSDVPIYSAGWQGFARGIGSSFNTLLGLSVYLTAQRLPDAGHVWRYGLRRGAMIIGLGLIITVATFFSAGDEFVRFGILHELGVALILCTALVRLPYLWNATIALIMIAAGFALGNLRLDTPWLLWLNIVPPDMGMVDFYPLIPWGGFAVLGLALGPVFYPGGRRRFGLPDLGDFAPVRGLNFLGRNSLVIYLLHQPLILALLYGYMRLLGR